MTALRAAFEWMRARLFNRPDSEHKQVLVRIAITALFSAYLGWHVGAEAASSQLFVVWLILLGECLVSVALLAGILHDPRISHVRRWIGMLADYTAIGAVMALQGETASPLYGVYLWVTIGNGLRYGSRYLYFATGLSSLSFLAMISTTPYWQNNPYLSWGLLAGAAAVPLYFASLLKALTRAIEDARRANEAKSRFLANMSHELRTPLNGILAMAELLSASKLQKDQRESADMIQTSAQTLLLLIDEVLDISAIEAGKIRRQDQDFELTELLSRVYRMLHPQAQSKGLSLHVDTDIRVPGSLYGDVTHLTQILLNLLQNAVKFTQQGSVTLQVRELSRDNERIRLRISVRDTGIGIPEEARIRIFKPFEQVDSGRDRRYGGSGLGTTIAKSLTELMGGTIGVEPNPGGGTHFWVELPFKFCSAQPVAAAEKLEEEVASAPLSDVAAVMSAGGKLGENSANVINFEDPFLRHRLRVRNLLVVVADDQPANRIVLQRLLEKAGHRTIFAENGEEVLDILAQEQPDLVIIDLHMPGLSGVDVIRQARVMQAGQAARTPIIVLSADATVEAIKEAQRAGAYLYMTKPISVPKLLDTLSNVASEVVMQTASDAAGRDAAAKQEAVSKSAVDSTASVLEELAGMGLGEQFLREFVEQCLRDISRCMSQLQSASANADYDGMRESAHALRGVAENIGAIRLVERCRLVMRIDSVQLAKQAAHLTRDLDALVEQTAREVHAQLPQLLNPGLGRLDPKPGPDPL
jgi:two-component system, sensor histidine kinase RpfC